MSTVIVDAIIPVYIKKITDFLQASDITNATSAMFVVIALYLGMRVLTFIGIHLVSWYESRTARDLHNLTYEYFTQHSYHFYKDQFTGSLVS